MWLLKNWKEDETKGRWFQNESGNRMKKISFLNRSSFLITWR